MDLEITMLLDEIDEQQYMAEMAVMDALMDAYMKEATMLEYCSEEVVQECFYQEGLMDDIKVGIKGVDGESILKKILLFIPRLIASFVNWVKSKFNKTPEKTVSSAVQAAKSLDEPTAQVVEKTAEIVDTMVKEERTEPTKAEKETLSSLLQTINNNPKSIDALKAGANIVKRSDTKLGDASYDQNEFDIKSNTFIPTGKSRALQGDPINDKAHRDYREAEKNGDKQKMDEASNNFHHQPYVHITKDELIETVKTIASYQIKIQSRFKNSKIKASEQVDTLRQVAVGLREGKIYSGIDIELCKTNLQKYNTLLKKMESIVDEFDKGDKFSVQKFDKNITSTYTWARKNMSIWNRREGETSIDYNGRMTIKRNVGWVNQTKGDLIPLDKFQNDIVEIRQQMSEVMKRTNGLWKRFEDDMDIKKYVNKRNRQNTSNELDELRKVDKAFADNNIDDKEHDKRSRDISRKYDNNETAEMVNAFSRIRDILVRVTDGSRNVVNAINDTETEMKIYLQLVNSLKSGKKTSKSLKLAQKSSTSTKFEINNSMYDGAEGIRI